MYYSKPIDELISFIEENDGIGDKIKMQKLVAERFQLTKDGRSIYVAKEYALRFIYSKFCKKNVSNTVISLSTLKKYDGRPFIVCLVTPNKNYTFLANTTFIKKISQTSQQLASNLIRGSFNVPNVYMEYGGVRNEASSFERLYAYHEAFTFEENLERLVEATSNIVARGSKFAVTDENKMTILGAVERAKNFMNSNEYNILKNDLDERVKKAQGEIAIAAYIDDVNIRGRIIEFLITSDDHNLKTCIMKALRDNQAIPEFTTADDLGDYSRKFENYITETDIKTKILFLSSNPKAYNLDKFIEFLAEDESVFLIYILGINDNSRFVSKLVSAFDNRLLSTMYINNLWAGRNSRGVAQYTGVALDHILESDDNGIVDEEKSREFLKMIINR